MFIFFTVLIYAPSSWRHCIQSTLLEFDQMRHFLNSHFCYQQRIDTNGKNQTNIIIFHLCIERYIAGQASYPK